MGVSHCMLVYRHSHWGNQAAGIHGSIIVVFEKHSLFRHQINSSWLCIFTYPSIHPWMYIYMYIYIHIINDIYIYVYHRLYPINMSYDIPKNKPSISPRLILQVRHHCQIRGRGHGGRTRSDAQRRQQLKRWLKTYPQTVNMFIYGWIYKHYIICLCGYMMNILIMIYYKHVDRSYTVYIYI